jgi:hypothetical protein
MERGDAKAEPNETGTLSRLPVCFEPEFLTSYGLKGSDSCYAGWRGDDGECRDVDGSG